MVLVATPRPETDAAGASSEAAPLPDAEATPEARDSSRASDVRSIVAVSSAALHPPGAPGPREPACDGEAR